MSIKAIYMYTDERGLPVMRKVRREPKAFRMQAARYKHNRLYWKGEPGCIERHQPEWRDKALYRLIELLDALKYGEPVFLVEGERDADCLASLKKFCTTTNWQGAGKFTPEQADWFTRGRGRSPLHIVIDNDDAGYWAGWQRYSALIAAGVGRKRLAVWRPWSSEAKDITDAVLVGIRGCVLTSVDPSALKRRAAAVDAERVARYTFAELAS